jgi:hypothetical protein
MHCKERWSSAASNSSTKMAAVLVCAFASVPALSNALKLPTIKFKILAQAIDLLAERELNDVNAPHYLTAVTFQVIRVHPFQEKGE